MRMTRLVAGLCATLLVVPLAPRPASAGEWSFDGRIVGEVRGFPYSPEFGAGDKPGFDDIAIIDGVTVDFIALPTLDSIKNRPVQSNQRVWPSIAIYPHLTYEWNEGDDIFSLLPFARLDPYNARRSHFDLREFYWLHQEEAWDLVFGVTEVFWGVVESWHLVDVINQLDQVEDVTQDEKLGQPMVNLNLFTEYGEFELYYLPRFRERTFPSDNARLRGPFPIDEDATIFSSGLGKWHPDVAARYENTFDSLDMALSVFHGTSRQPNFVVQIRKDGIFTVPSYDIMTQLGLEATYVYEEWLFKLETIGRFGQGKPFPATVGGFEYTFFDAANQGIDLGVIGEYIYDGRDDTAPATPFENDGFVGLRLTFNDQYDTNFLTGAFIDVDTRATFYNFELTRRLDDDWSIEIDGRFFINIPNDDPLAPVRRDSFVQLKLARYF